MTQTQWWGAHRTCRGRWRDTRHAGVWYSVGEPACRSVPCIQTMMTATSWRHTLSRARHRPTKGWQQGKQLAQAGSISNPHVAGQYSRQPPVSACHSQLFVVGVPGHMVAAILVQVEQAAVVAGAWLQLLYSSLDLENNLQEQQQHNIRPYSLVCGMLSLLIPGWLLIDVAGCKSGMQAWGHGGSQRAASLHCGAKQPQCAPVTATCVGAATPCLPYLCPGRWLQREA